MLVQSQCKWFSIYRFLSPHNLRSQVYVTFLFQTKDQQAQVLNQSNKVFLYCAFLDYRWVCVYELYAACLNYSFKMRSQRDFILIVACSFARVLKVLNHKKLPVIWKRCVSLFSFKSKTSSVACVAVLVLCLLQQPR